MTENFIFIAAGPSRGCRTYRFSDRQCNRLVSADAALILGLQALCYARNHRLALPKARLCPKFPETSRSLAKDKEKMVAAISRRRIPAGRKANRLYRCVRERGQTLAGRAAVVYFEAAQWFNDLTRALVIVNLRDTTYIAHGDEKPLDPFKNAVKLYIRAPRFSLMIRKRLELVLERMQGDKKLEKRQRFTLKSGAQVTYASNPLSEFLLSIYASISRPHSAHRWPNRIACRERRAERALAMFADVCAFTAHPDEPYRVDCGRRQCRADVEQDRIIRALMRGRSKCEIIRADTFITSYRTSQKSCALVTSYMRTSWSI